MKKIYRIRSTELFETGTSSKQDTESIEYDWIFSDLCCISCRRSTVWEALESEVDYGGGNRYLCTSCGQEFYGRVTRLSRVVSYMRFRDTINKLKSCESEE